ncbi:MAG: hypothetical protein WBA10_01485 [Elainellaceae cyanobacterium]
MVKSNSKLVVQAEQGSVAAIIQVLNQQLSTSGIRVRAVLVRGVLQLLCEAVDSALLERHQLVQRIRQILESLHPRHIRRVCINSRIINEQQLLWLDEINRDPAGQLLWSEEILLARPNIVVRWLNAWRSPGSKDDILPVAKDRRRYAQRQFWRGLWGGAILGAGLLMVGGLLYIWLRETAPGNASVGLLPDSNTSKVSPTSGDGVASSASTTSDTAIAESNPSQDSDGAAKSDRAGEVTTTSTATIDLDREATGAVDPFARAVQLAERSAAQGQTASTAAEWNDIAVTWQQASELMGQVPPTDNRYNTAQDRYQLYQGYANEARSQAQTRQGQ